MDPVLVDLFQHIVSVWITFAALGHCVIMIPLVLQVQEGIPYDG